MKLELLIPPNPYLGDDKRNPPLGMLYLAAIAEKQGYEIRVTDLRGISLDCFDELIPRNSQAYGITASTPDYPLAKKIAEIVKLKNPSAWTILGGSHATTSLEEIDPIFDKIVVGEGEQSLLRILKDFEKGNSDQRIYKSKLITNLDSIPFPAFHLVPFDSAFSVNALYVGAGPTGTIMTSRGCPFSCSFCANTAVWNKHVRFRSPENVVEEIKSTMEKYGIKNFRFHDDTMMLRKKRLEELCRRIKPLGIKWRAATRVDTASESSLKQIKDAGCEEIAYGFESFSQEVLDKVNKGIQVKDFYTVLAATKKVGLKSRLYLIIGLPGEQPGFADRLINFSEQTKPDAIDLSTFVPFPGSDIQRNPKKYGFGLKNEEDFSHYVFTRGLKNGEDDQDFTFEHDVMTNNQLKNERRRSLEYIMKKKMVKNL